MTTSPLSTPATEVQLPVPMRVELSATSVVGATTSLLAELERVSLLRSSLQGELERVHELRVGVR